MMIIITIITIKITINRHYLLVIRRRLTVVPGQVLSQPLRVRRVWHMIISRLHHLELQLMFLLQRHRPQRRHSQQRRNVRFRCRIPIITTSISSLHHGIPNHNATANTHHAFPAIIHIEQRRCHPATRRLLRRRRRFRRRQRHLNARPGNHLLRNGFQRRHAIRQLGQ